MLFKFNFKNNKLQNYALIVSVGCKQESEHYSFLDVKHESKLRRILLFFQYIEKANIASEFFFALIVLLIFFQAYIRYISDINIELYELFFSNNSKLLGFSDSFNYIFSKYFLMQTLVG